LFDVVRGLWVLVGDAAVGIDGDLDAGPPTAGVGVEYGGQGAGDAVHDVVVAAATVGHIDDGAGQRSVGGHGAGGEDGGGGGAHRHGDTVTDGERCRGTAAEGASGDLDRGGVARGGRDMAGELPG